MPLIRILKKGQITLPAGLRLKARIGEGDLLDARLSRGGILLTPKTLVDRHIAESEKDYREGRSYGPFDTADEMIASLQSQLKERARKKGARK